VDKEKIENLLQDVKNNKLEIKDAIKKLQTLPYEDINFAKLDNHRAIRQGYGEVIFCEGKTVAQVQTIAYKLSQNHKIIIATRANQEMFNAVKKDLPEAIFHEAAKIIQVGEMPKPLSSKKILIITAGTSDLPVAEEAKITAISMAANAEILADVGVSGIHRLLSNLDKIRSADIIVAVAGMEGALPSIIAGLVDIPVIAVPTSVGYGANFHGISALLTMLNSCAPGMSVVNIDNGFGAGYLAAMIVNGE